MQDSIHESANISKLCLQYGKLYYSKANYKKSISCFECALRFSRSNELDLKLQSLAYSYLSELYWKVNDASMAVSYMKQDLFIATVMACPGSLFRCYSNLANAYYFKGEFRRSLMYRRHQLTVALKLKNLPPIIMVLKEVAYLHAMIGMYKLAVRILQRCLHLSAKLNDDLLQLAVMNDLSVLQLVLAHFDSSLKVSEEHLRLSELLNNRREEVEAYKNMACVHLATGSYNKSIECLNNILHLNNNHFHNDPYLQMTTHSMLGHVYLATNELKKANLYFEKQLNQALKCCDDSAEARACFNLGMLFEKANNFKSATKLYERTLALVDHDIDATIYENFPQSLVAFRGRLYFHIGCYFEKLKCYDVTLEAYKRALQIYRSSNLENCEAVCLRSLSHLYSQLDQMDSCLKYFKMYANLASYSGASTSGKHCTSYMYEAKLTDLIRLDKLARSKLIAGNLQEAVEIFELFLSSVDWLQQFQQPQQLQQYQPQNKQQIENAHNLTYTRLHVLDNLAHVNYKLERYNEAFNYYSMALPLCQNLKRLKREIRCLQYLGNIKLRQQCYMQALQFFEQCLRLVQANNKDVNFDGGEVKLVSSVENLSQTEVSDKLLDNNNIGESNSNSNNNSDHVNNNPSPISSPKSTETRILEAILLLNISDCYMMLGQLAEARNHLYCILKNRTTTRLLMQYNVRCFQRCALNMGTCCMWLARLHEAIASFLVYAHVSQLQCVQSSCCYDDAGDSNEMLGYKMMSECYEMHAQLPWAVECVLKIKKILSSLSSFQSPSNDATLTSLSPPSLPSMLKDFNDYVQFKLNNNDITACALSDDEMMKIFSCGVKYLLNNFSASGKKSWKILLHLVEKSLWKMQCVNDHNNNDNNNTINNNSYNSSCSNGSRRNNYKDMYITQESFINRMKKTGKKNVTIKCDINNNNNNNNNSNINVTNDNNNKIKKSNVDTSQRNLIGAMMVMVTLGFTMRATPTNNDGYNEGKKIERLIIFPRKDKNNLMRIFVSTLKRLPGWLHVFY
ncbi:hypothetical protein HELRODRAFT_189214 [Helobdella robusta]|uniref:MalT-like TPR region domain-containing protein n=1 Tax=Helobdella robusta TaxID=6412 RepID=T1FQS9_HELRO|nr:hypothetical protein HELRODRAFT_189214 [Helobdella robusta]ESN96359.1 hypothetical protein HELRODRAFT_189214 [Helobdella robusta]